MLSIDYIENNKDEIIRLLNTRQKNYTKEISELLLLNKKRKKIIYDLENLKFEKNKITKDVQNKIVVLKSVKVKLQEIEKEILYLEKILSDIESKIFTININIPNIPDKSVITGFDENDNKEIRNWNDDKKVASNLSHWEIAEKLGLIDFKFGTKLAGSRYVVYKNKGSQLIRALIDILLKKHSKKGYQEFWLPLIVNDNIMFGTGQLPKFEEDLYKLQEGDQYLIPTAEVPLTNLLNSEVIEHSNLPLYYTAFTQCFRKEAGSAGKDTKGIIRLHQFNKVEMVKITDKDSSFIELEKMVEDAEECLKLFNLPYRVLMLCTGDMGFASAKTYDLEVWFPSQNKYREISSCSNCLDFQSRRMNSKYRVNGKLEYLHTLNGSGLAIDRLLAAILENYYDGEKLVLPDVLRPYFDNKSFIE